MARIARNTVKVRLLPNGSLQLYGEVLGKRVRERFTDANKLEARKAELLRQIAVQAEAIAHSPQLRLTRLTDEQLRDAEAAVQMAGGRRLVECVAAAQRVLPPINAITCEFAMAEWLKASKDRKRTSTTLAKNRLRVDNFIEFAKPKHLVDITPDTIERWAYRRGAADYTRITDAQVLRAWLNFAVRRRWLAITPFEIDMKDMSATAQPKAAGRILSPEQCHAYLDAARNYRAGLLVPYVILTTWLFMRESEARRVRKADMRLDVSPPVIRVAAVKRGTAKLRTITVPKNILPILREVVKDWPGERRVPFSRSSWTTIREHAGLLVRGKTTRHKRRPILESQWQSDIARHSGISYLYQQSRDIKDVCRQAGNSSDVSFRHYLTLPEEGAAARFYAAVKLSGGASGTPHPQAPAQPAQP